jgi:23S rRNA (guanine745-N1)-methyltransferase
MIRSRRRFLQRGYYAPLVEPMLAGLYPNNSVLDVGCGDGWFTSQMARRAGCVVGLDLAKTAARLAARHDRRGTYVVANAVDLPVLDHSVDRLFSVFAPIASSEFFRVLQPGGAAVIVSPGSHHLCEVRKLLYPQLRLHDERVPLDGSSHFRLGARAHVSTQFWLSSAAEVFELIQMTPYRWHLSDLAHSRLGNAAPLWVTAHFMISSYSPMRRR